MSIFYLVGKVLISLALAVVPLAIVLTVLYKEQAIFSKQPTWVAVVQSLAVLSILGMGVHFIIYCLLKIWGLI